MSTSESDDSSTSPSELNTAPSPTDSGTASEQQQEASLTIAGELVPNPQLSRIANRVSDEASGLVAVDPAAMASLGALRLASSYMNEQATNAAALRKDVAETQERERAAAADAGDLRIKLAVARNINNTENKLRKPRTVVSVLGVTVASFGVDQFGDGNRELGVLLVIIGLAMAAATYLIAPADGEKQ